MRYLVHCVAGLQEVVAAQLQREGLGPMRFLEREEGFLLLETGRRAPSLANLSYLNNVFLVLSASERVEPQGLAPALARLAEAETWHRPLIDAMHPRERWFRLMLSDENRLVAGDREPIDKIIATIARLTGMAFRPRGGDVELWLIRRRSGRVYFCRRLSQRERTERDLEKGELRPELTHLLCLLSEPKPTDVFLDPYAGSGALPLARAQWPYNLIYAIDHDREKVQAIRRKFKEVERTLAKGGAFIARVEEATALSKFEDGFIDAIVTDPPWGLFDPSVGDPGAHYEAMLTGFCRVVKPGGRVVALLGRDALVDGLVESFGDRLELELRADLLVAGQKAVVLKWRRRGEML